MLKIYNKIVDVVPIISKNIEANLLEEGRKLVS